MYEDDEKKGFFKTENKTLIFLTFGVGALLAVLVIFFMYEVHKHPNSILGLATSFLPKGVQGKIGEVQKYGKRAQQYVNQGQQYANQAQQYINQGKEVMNQVQGVVNQGANVANVAKNVANQYIQPNAQQYAQQYARQYAQQYAPRGMQYYQNYYPYYR